MNSTEEILKSVVEEYRDIESSHEEPELLKKCAKIQHSLIIIIKQQLVDTKEIILEIQKAKPQLSQTQTVLNFFNYLIDGFPHPVFVPSLEQSHSLRENEVNDYMKVYLEFLYLLASRLLQLVVLDELNTLHETAFNTLILLLELIKMQNPIIYQKLLDEFINLYIELHEIKTEQYYTDTNIKTGEVKLKSFGFVLSQQKDVPALAISNISNLENWQIACSNLLQMYINDTVLLVCPKISSLLTVSLHQIMFGPFSLKIVATKFCSSLIDSGSRLSEKGIELFMSCILSLIDLLSFKSMQSKFRDNGVTEEEISNYHQALMQFLADIFVLTYSKTPLSLQSPPKPQLILDFRELSCLTARLSAFMHDNTDAKWDKAIFNVCNFVAICGIQFASKDIMLITTAFTTDIFNIIKSLICNSTGFENVQVLTNFCSLLCMFQTQVTPIQTSMKSTSNVDQTAKRLSRKRPHESNETKDQTKQDEQHLHVFSDLCNVIKNNCENHVSELHQLIQQFQHQKQSFGIVLNKLKSRLESLCLAFEAFLHSLVFLRNNKSYCNMLVTGNETVNFESIFGKYVEVFIVFLSSQNILQSEACKSQSLVIYEVLVRVAKYFVIWHHVLQVELSISVSQESRKMLEVMLVVLSCVWLEDVPWKDLKVGFLPFLSKSNLIAACQSLNLLDLCLKTSNVSHEQQYSILSDCLTGLVYFPESISPMWRSSVLTQWTFSCVLDEIDAKTVSLFPLYCSKLKHVNILPVVHDLLSFIQTKIKVSQVSELIKNLVQTVSTLTLVMTQNFAVTTVLLHDQSKTPPVLLKTCLSLEKQGDSMLLEKDYLEFVFEVMKISCSHLNSYKLNLRSDKWSFLFLDLVNGLTTVLQCCNKKKIESQNLLKEFIRLLSWEVNVEKFDPLFLDFDDSKWCKLLSDEIEASLKIPVLRENDIAVCNLAVLIGSILNECGKENRCDSSLFSKCLELLCILFCSKSLKVRSVAFTQLEKLSLVQKSVLEMNKKLVSVSLINGFLDNELSHSYALQVIEDVSSIYSVSLSSFLNSNFRYLLPPLILKQATLPNEKPNKLMELFSNCLTCTISDLIKQNFKHIFCYAVTSGSDYERLFEHLEHQTKIKKDSLLLMTHGSLIQHLLAHISVSSDRVCHALQYIHHVKTSEDVALPVSELLKPHFLSVLIFFNSQLRLGNVTLDDKLQVYESLIRLLYLLDTAYVTTVCVKIINTLCLAQQVFIHSSKASICCKAWHALVCCVDDSSLGSLLSQVVAMLLPCLEEYPNEVATTLEYIIVDMHQHTKSNFAELYFLPNHKSLRKVKSHLEKELHFNRSSSSAFLRILEQATNHLLHDSAEVRQYALQEIRTVLKSNQIALQRNNLIAGGVSDLIQSLISALLNCCRDANSQIKLLSAKCLGEIGAVDPDKLNFVLTCNKPKSQSCDSFDDEDFTFDLFNCLVQAFLVAKPSHQDISAFAIQELLKIYNCREGPKDTPGRKLWRRFSEQMQAVLEPHLSSRYVLKKSEINLSTLTRPILHRKQNMTFREWIGTFCAVLMQMASSLIEKTSVVRRVFDACTSVVRSNVDVAFFLLPLTVVEVLKSGDEHLDFIKEEMMAVLESTQVLQDSKKPHNSAGDVTSSSERNDENVPGKEMTNFSVLSSHLSLLSAQAVFSVLDHITLWLQKRTAAHAGGALARTKLAKEKEKASKFLAMIPQKMLATASLHCKDYKRALLHYETFLRDQSSSQLEVDSAAFLQRVFIEMNETDGVLGVVNVRGVEPSLETRLLVLESTGALQDAAACYERIICHNPSDVFHYKGFFKCLIDLGQLSEAVNLIDGTIANNPSWKSELTSYGIEACWRLGRWDMLEKKVETISAPEHQSWSVGIGEAILAIREKNWSKLEDLLDNLYQSQTDSLAVASMETNSFQRGYDHILRLHALSDVERFSNILRGQSEVSSFDDVMSLWQLRLQVVQPSFRACDPVLSLGRVMLPLLCNLTETDSNCDRYVGKLWLQTSKLARKCGLLQTAYGALLSAQRYALPGYCIEHAKWLWQKGESHQALLTLQRGFAEHYSSDSATINIEQRLERAKVMLLEAKLMEESSSYDSNVVLRKYKEVVAYMGEWEDSHFYCGRYYDKLMTSMMGENRAAAKSQHLYYIMSHYGRSLCFGTSHIYESLTKLLTLWLDYGETAAKLEKAGRPQSYEDVQRLVDVISDVRARLPTYVFYVAFSQLTSRICHQHEPTYNQLKEILVSVILDFPQRALWSMIAISKSSFKQRANRCQEIFDRVRFKQPKLAPLINNFITLTNRLLDLCNKPVSSIQPLSIASHFKQLKKLVEGNNFSEIMLPLQKFMNVVLPQSKRSSDLGSQSKHNPFPEALAHIVGFEDSVEILPSLQRPKKISIRASDGKSYTFLCKPKDDLRKDARLTEFAAIVNKCLYRDAESGKRHLRIRTYTVVPLNEECGLIEWVENMKGLRHILLPIYKAQSLYCSGKQLKAWQLPVSAPLQKKLEVFRTKYLPRHPPVFYEWFLTTFTNPSSWYNARLAYARSVAVMSMVGYILGLGDRHGENILFDSKNGEAMHVDFNCLFNKGLSLEVPEIVPFRLTHNMVDAMGPTKYEGFFRKACEVTMNVLREQREPLMSVLKTFIYDPLVEWSKKSRGSASSGEILSEKALSHVNDIDKRLRGIVGKNKGMPLSIEGHVHYLIQEAADEEKLCQMYIGWAPFM